jgi:hypothetical protein
MDLTLKWPIAIRFCLQVVFFLCWLGGSFCAGAASFGALAFAATVQDFDVAARQSPFVLTRYGNPPNAAFLPGGPLGTGKFLRLAYINPAPSPPSFNTVTFDRSDPGAFSQIVADFDFRMEPGKDRADGLGFALLNTAIFGNSGGVRGGAEEPNFAGSLGVGFDIYKNYETGDIGDERSRSLFSNSVSIHFNGAVIAQFDVSSTTDLASGQWIHARILVRAGDASGDVSVILTACPDTPVTVVNRLPIPGLTAYESRVYFGARGGGLTANFDLDNVNVQFGDPSQSIISLGSVSYTAEETSRAAVISVVRTGNLTQSATVRCLTSPLTATANIDYSAWQQVLFFRPGQRSASCQIPLRDDVIREPDETFTVSLATSTQGAVIGGPARALVTIFDDETAQVVGHWEAPRCLPILGVHLHLLPTGKVLVWDRLAHARLWDPASQTLTAPSRPNPGYDAFCSGHAFLADGSLLVTGGHLGSGDHRHDGVGLLSASLYHPLTDTWTRLPDMSAGRWYPTNTTLGNGDMLVVSGSQDTNATINLLPQVWQTANGTWRNLTTAQSAAALGISLYPRMFLLSDGRVFKAGEDQDTWFLDPSGTGAWRQGPTSHFGWRSYGGAVQYGKDKFLIVGGGDPPTASAEVLDLHTATPAWRTVAPMALARRHLSTTVLPDGQVLITGGVSGPGFDDTTRPALAAELWNPANEQWTTLPAAKIVRGYHSAALLLPNGKVLIAGGGQGSDSTRFELAAELYSPAYLFRKPRPVITSAPAVVAHGAAFIVGSPDAATINKVTLIRLPSVTHAFDQNQRFLELAFARKTIGQLEVTVPTNPNLLPPGHYMLFILNEAGTPSVAKIIQVR